MQIILIFLLVLLVLVILITCFVILLQDDQGDGFSLFGSSGQSPFSAASNPLARITPILGTSFLVLILAVALIISLEGTKNNFSSTSGRYFNEDNWALQDAEAQQAVQTETISESQTLEVGQ